jgi:hypothetical protein
MQKSLSLSLCAIPFNRNISVIHRAELVPAPGTEAANFCPVL